MSRDDVVRSIVREMIDDPEVALEGWATLLALATFARSTSGVEGFCLFSNGDCQAVLPSEKVEELIGELREVISVEDKKRPFVACLVKIKVKGDDVDADIDFEYADVNRWNLDPSMSAAEVNRQVHSWSA